MRIAIALAAILSATLAGCGQRPDTGQDGQNRAGASQRPGLPTPGPRPDGNTSADLGSDQAFRQSYRELNLATCISSARARAAQGTGAPPGTDFRRFCTCSVDRTMAGLSVEQLTELRPSPREQAIAEQCARESGLAFDGDSGGTGGK